MEHGNMLILSNVLALALIVLDEPRPAQAPMTVTGHLTGTVSGSTPADASNLPSTMPKMSKPRTSGIDEPIEAWEMTLPEAIKIGLDNSEVIRVISQGARGIPLSNFHPNPPENLEPPADSSLVIAPLNRDTSTWKFKADVMAHVRSIEQQYWELAHQHVVLGSWETAVTLAKEILAREKADLTPTRGGNTADIAEAEQQLEKFQLNLVSATSDVITTERQLRNILDLPANDNRRIVPTTAPIEARIEPNWELSLGQMLESQPDLAQQNALVRLAELQLLLARNQLLPLLGPDDLHRLGGLGDRPDEIVKGLAGSILKEVTRRQPAVVDHAEPREPEFIASQVGLIFLMPISVGRAPLYNTRQCQYQLLRQRATLEQITHQTTHSLARFFLEIDANYKQYQTAQRLRASAQQRLESQRAFYEEGRVTIDRLLDAMAQHSNAIATEALYKTSYNSSIASFEEAKGTLLDYDNIAVAEGPRPRKAYIQARDQQVAETSLEQPPLPPTPDLPPLSPEPALAANAHPTPMMYWAGGCYGRKFVIWDWHLCLNLGCQFCCIKNLFSDAPKRNARIGGVNFLEIEVGPDPQENCKVLIRGGMIDDRRPMRIGDLSLVPTQRECELLRCPPPY
jgi:Outer membrane efflux protein